MKLSVIIPTLNGGSTLGKLLAALESQSFPPLEIIVVDSGSSDATTDIARSFNVKLLTIPGEDFDHGGTRNFAAAGAEGDTLVFMTQDALPHDSQMLSRLVEPLQQPGVALSYARQVAPPDVSPLEQYLRLAHYPPQSQVRSKEDFPVLGISALRNSNVCAAYRRDIFEHLGLFPSPVVCNEDMLYAARAIFAGYKVAYCAEAVVWHSHSYSHVQLFKRYFDIGASLDYEPRLRTAGKTGTQGLRFVKGCLAYLKQQKKMEYLPKALIDSASRYLGFRIGSRHHLLPGRLKKHLGLNCNYWSFMLE